MKIKLFDTGNKSMSMFEINNIVIVISYETLVAVKYENTFYQTSKKYSRTTSSHISYALSRLYQSISWSNNLDTEYLSPEELNNKLEYLLYSTTKENILCKLNLKE